MFLPRCFVWGLPLVCLLAACDSPPEPVAKAPAFSEPQSAPQVSGGIRLEEGTRVGIRLSGGAPCEASSISCAKDSSGKP